MVLMLERILGHDECPLFLQNQLREGTEIPVFVLKNRQSRSDKTSSTFQRSANNTSFSDSKSSRDPSYLLQTQRGGSDFISPRPDGSTSALRSVLKQSNTISTSFSSSSGISSGNNNSSGVVAIHNYRAEREDELNVTIGDRFSILRIEGAWAVVKRKGVSSEQKMGWVPLGVLNDKSSISNTDDQEEKSTSSNFLASSNIVNTNTPTSSSSSSASSSTAKSSPNDSKPVIRGVVLYDYKAGSANELGVRKGDNVVVQKKVDPWLLVEHEGQRGWVPASYVNVLKKVEVSSLFFNF